MKNDSGSGLATGLEEVRRELHAWRAMPVKRQKIPEPIWQKAMQAARRYGLNPVSKALGLDYSCLKKRVAGAAKRKESELTPAFVEVNTGASPDDLACVIEMEKGGGTRMRICVKSAGSVDWLRIKEAFLGA